MWALPAACVAAAGTNLTLAWTGAYGNTSVPFAASATTTTSAYDPHCSPTVAGCSLLKSLRVFFGGRAHDAGCCGRWIDWVRRCRYRVIAAVIPAHDVRVVPILLCWEFTGLNKMVNYAATVSVRRREGGGARCAAARVALFTCLRGRLHPRCYTRTTQASFRSTCKWRCLVSSRAPVV